MSRLRQETGSTVVTALLAAVVMLLLGMALLQIVDTQAAQSGQERTRDHAFNLSESVLNTEAFVLSRDWPEVAPAGNPKCSAAGAGFTDAIGSSDPASPAAVKLRPTLNDTFKAGVYDGSWWQVNICDDFAGVTVWQDTLLDNATWDANRNNMVWVRAQSDVRGKKRVVVGLVRVRNTAVLESKYALVAGRVTDDLGSTVNNLSSNLLGGVLNGLLGTTPTVAADPTHVTTPPSSGVTGVRCGALDTTVVPAVTCLSGTLGSASAVPLISALVTGGRLEKFPRATTAMEPEHIDRLRSQAVGTNTYYSASVGGATVATAPACSFTTNTGLRSATTVVFIEKVGTGDQYCVLDVSAGVKWKALVVGSGRVIIRGNGTSTGTPTASTAPQANTFSGVVYGLNLQRHPVAEGGQGLGDASTPGREIVVLDKGAHVKGGVYADGKSGRITINAPDLSLNQNSLIDALIPCSPLPLVGCSLRNLIKALPLVNVIDRLVTEVGVTAAVNGILGQLQTQRQAYGSAIVADNAAIDSLTAYGTSGIVTGTFKEIAPAATAGAPAP